VLKIVSGTGAVVLYSRHSSCSSAKRRYVPVHKNFRQLDCHADFLRTFLWSRLSRSIRHRNSDCAPDVVQISETVWRRPQQWLDKRPGKKSWAVHGASKLSEAEIYFRLYIFSRRHVADNLNKIVNSYWNRVASDGNSWTWSNTRNRMQTPKFKITFTYYKSVKTREIS
jgi:hypothetical protein